MKALVRLALIGSVAAATTVVAEVATVKPALQAKLEALEDLKVARDYIRLWKGE